MNSKRPWRDDAVWNSFIPRKDENGHKLCEMHDCPKLLTGRQERWCSKKCVWDALAKCQWTVARKRILRRDSYKCVKCGQPAEEVDHITPICEGGNLCDPNNLRALCREHHRAETAALAARRALKRRELMSA